MSEVIVVTSGKGGVGKTTTAANIGTGLAALDKKVVLVDTDIGLRNLDVVLGLENRIVYNLVDVIEGNCRLKQALIKDKRYANLFLLPSAQTRDKTSVTPEQMKKLCEERLCPSGLSGRNRAGLSKCDCRGFQSTGGDNAGGFCDSRCRPNHRTSGGGGSERYPSDHQPSPYGYGKTWRYDVH